jgi:hypothetical protein
MKRARRTQILLISPAGWVGDEEKLKFRKASELDGGLAFNHTFFLSGTLCAQHREEDQLRAGAGVRRA